MNIKTFILSCLLAIIAIHANTEDVDFVVDGLGYRITSTTDLTVEVVRGPDLAVVTVPSTVVFNKRTFRVKGIGSWAFSYANNLESIDMPSITDIPNCTFWYCSHLTHVNMPAVKHIGVGAFYSCPSLPSVDLPVATSIGDSAFYDCEALTSLSMPAATSIGESAFYNCYALTSVSLPAATSIGSGAFYSCWRLTGVDMPSATSIGESAFYHCSLTSVTLPAATSIGNNAFYDCNDLTSVTLPAATSIGNGAFKCCGALTSVTLSAATSIGNNAFNNCNALTSVSMPAATSIGDGAFIYCASLCDIYVGEQPAVFKLIGNNPPFDKVTYATATLHVPTGCAPKYKAANIWKNFNFISEDYNPTGIKSTKADNVKIHTDNGYVQLTGLKEREKVEFYSISGQLLGAPIANGGTVSIKTSEHVVICKMGGSSVKILVK